MISVEHSRGVRAALLASALLIATPFGARAQTTDTLLMRLEREISRLATIAGGTMGVAAVHLESGREVYLNRDVPFPMASSVKVAIATELLSRVDRRTLRLDSMIALKPNDLHPGSGTLTELFDDPGVVLSVRNLLELTLLISDNSATDIVLRLAGGGAAVTRRMQELGIQGVRIDRPTNRLIADWLGVALSDTAQPTIEQFNVLARGLNAEQRSAAAKAFDIDPRDTATPAGMAALLSTIWRGKALKPETTKLLLDIMTRSTTGTTRIKGMLPPTISVAHKTGTIGGTTNDVGIVTLPENAGHVVVVAMVKASALPVETRERAIAQVSRSIYDYFLFNR
jgi:beta-lactamase class A